MSNIYEALRRSEAQRRAARKEDAGRTDAQASGGGETFDAESASAVDEPSVLDALGPGPARKVTPLGLPPGGDETQAQQATSAKAAQHQAELPAPRFNRSSPPAPRTPSAAYAPHPPSPYLDSEPTHRDDDLAAEIRRVATVLFRRKWEVLLAASMVVVSAAVATSLTPRLYRSIAQVQVDPEPVQVLPYPDIDKSGTGPYFEMFMKTQEQVLRGPALRERVARRLQSEPDANALAGERGRLGGAFSVQRLENTQLYRLGYVAPQPETAARVANFFAEEYIKLNFENRQETRLKAKELLERELEKLGQKVQVSDRELVTYAQQNKVPMADPTLATSQEKISELSSQLSEAQAQVIIEQSKLTTLQNASITNFPDTLATSMVQTAKGKIAQLEQELVVLRSTFGENWPAVVQKRAEIKLAQEQLDSERATALGHARDQAVLSHRLAEEKLGRLASSLEEEKRLVREVETALVQYNILRREVETNQKMYDAMLERVQQTSVAAGMEFGGLRLIQAATPSYRPDSPRPGWNMALAVLLGVALGVAIAFVREFWNASIRTVDELERLTSMPVLGSTLHRVAADRSGALIPRIRAKAKRAALEPGRLLRGLPSHKATRPLLTGSVAEQATSEAVRHVCASILLSRSARPPRTILITSALSGEGKSTLARQVSEAFSEGGARTLLVECDLRRPTLGSALGIESNGGLTLFLSGQGGAFPGIYSTPSQNLYVVTAGPAAPNPPALFNSERMQTFLDQASARFQFVILDAPPVLPVADARVLAPLTEGVILVVRAGATSPKAIRRAASLLQHTGTPILGTVLNATDPRDASASEYGYYYPGYEES